MQNINYYLKHSIAKTTIQIFIVHTAYSIKYKHSFVVLGLVVVISVFVNWCNQCIHTFKAVTASSCNNHMVPPYQWSNTVKHDCNLLHNHNKTQHHDDVITWKHFPCYWPFVRGIHRSLVNSPHKGQWRRALMLPLICALNKQLSNQSWGWWFETPSRPLWRHYNDNMNKVHPLLHSELHQYRALCHEYIPWTHRGHPAKRALSAMMAGRALLVGYPRHVTVARLCISRVN